MDRRAAAGSMRATRRAGTAAAIADTTHSTPIATPHTTDDGGCTSVSMATRTRMAASAQASPTGIPTLTLVSVSAVTRAHTRPGRAPSARRTPTSLVRSVTDRDVSPYSPT